jgi:hypothetical protein
MSDFKKYIFNPETLLYDESTKPSRRKRFVLSLFWFALSVAAAVLYFWIYTSVLGLETPKTVMLKKENAMWRSKLELMNSQMAVYDEVLEDLAKRDDDIYRSIFGMNEIAPQVRNEGFGGVNRYSYLDGLETSSELRKSVMRMDVLTKKAYVQSRSFDDVASLAKKAGDMASCVPAISPVSVDKRKYRLSSPFGYRADPKSGRRAFHSGVDFSMKEGLPVFATGDGVVEEVKFEFWGYGTSILIDHGFGYKTRYAHLKGTGVTEGAKVKRGQQIATSGNTGKSTGPHLHYEVIYRGKHMNPVNYYDLDMPLEEFNAAVTLTDDSSFYIHPMHRSKKKKRR